MQNGYKILQTGNSVMQNQEHQLANNQQIKN